MTDFINLTQMFGNIPSKESSRRSTWLWWAVLLWVASMFSGCGDSAREQVLGQYRLDVRSVNTDPILADIRPEVKASIEGLAQTLSDALVYDFGTEDCAYVRGDDRIPFKCEYVRTEKSDVVVLRSEDHQGRTSFLRLRPTEDGIELNRLDHTISLKRVSP